MKRAGVEYLQMAVVVLLLSALVAAWGAYFVDRADDGDAASASTPTKATVASPDGGVPTCAEAVRNEGSYTCRTRTAVLTVTEEKEPLELPGLRLRLLNVGTVEPETGTGVREDRLRLELRITAQNRSSRTVTLNRDGNGIYLVLRGKRLKRDPNAGTPFRDPLKAGETRTGLLRFELSGPETKVLREDRGGDIGVQLPRSLDTASKSRVGVIRFANLRVE